MTRRLAFLAAVAVAGVAALPAPARASAGEQALSVTTGYTGFTTAKSSASGVALGVDYERGVSDLVSLWATGGGGLYFPDGLAFSGHAAGGVSYRLDIIKYVPYVDAAFGAMVIGGSGVHTEVDPMLELGLGVDVLTSRTFSYGALVRLTSYLGQSTILTAGVRVSWRWGFF